MSLNFTDPMELRRRVKCKLDYTVGIVPEVEPAPLEGSVISDSFPSGITRMKHFGIS